MRVNEYHNSFLQNLQQDAKRLTYPNKHCVFLQEIDACVNNLLLIRFFNCINCCCLLLSLSLYCRVGQSAVSGGQVNFPKKPQILCLPSKRNLFILQFIIAPTAITLSKTQILILQMIETSRVLGQKNCSWSIYMACEDM